MNPKCSNHIIYRIAGLGLLLSLLALIFVFVEPPYVRAQQEGTATLVESPTSAPTNTPSVSASAIATAAATATQADPGSSAPADDSDPALTATATDAVVVESMDATGDKEIIEQIALSEIEAVKTEDWQCNSFEVGEFKQDGIWAFMNLICWPSEQIDPNVFVPDIVLLALAHLENNKWGVYLEGSDEFSTLIQQIPETVVDSESKQALASMPSKIEALNTPQLNIAGTYTTGLPWRPGDTWRYNQSLHSCALDFGTPQCGVSTSVYPAESGTIVWAYETCMLVRRSDSTLEIGYQHINSGDISNWSAGSWINATDLIGNTTVSSGCGGDSTGHHVHFWMEDSGGCAINGSTLGGWTLNNLSFAI
jgi:hypothetical protein